MKKKRKRLSIELEPFHAEYNCPNCNEENSIEHGEFECESKYKESTGEFYMFHSCRKCKKSIRVLGDA